MQEIRGVIVNKLLSILIIAIFNSSLLATLAATQHFSK
jgi:hypothetical protein